MKRLICLLLALVCAAVLTGCTDAASRPAESAATLPPAVSAYDAPVGDTGLGREATAVLYLPGRDGRMLLAQYVPVQFTRAASDAETVVRALLAHPSNDHVSALGGSVALGLYGAHPVEVAGNVCTVNLSSSVLSLDFERRYTVFLALAATLGELDGIRFVNVLVADQAPGLDISGNLPAGSLTAHPGEELPLLWDQLDSRRTPLGVDPATQALNLPATLYFPLADGSGFVPETRNLAFPGQTPRQLTQTLLTALSSGAQVARGTAAMPNIDALLAQAPEVTELADGGRMVTLRFTVELDERLRLAGVDMTAFIGAMTTTIETFVPGVSAVRAYSGGVLLSALPGVAFDSGMQRRRQFADLLMEQATIYLARDGRLVPVTRALPARQANAPAQLLALLMAGPTAAERAAGLSAVLPAGMDASDVLGAAIRNDTLLLNLSPRFERLIRQAGPDGEQLLCYAMVSTLCQARGVRRMQFFFDGKMPELLGGSLYWGGEFILNTGLIDQTMG